MKTTRKERSAGRHKLPWRAVASLVLFLAIVAVGRLPQVGPGLGGGTGGQPSEAVEAGAESGENRVSGSAGSAEPLASADSWAPLERACPGSEDRSLCSSAPDAPDDADLEPLCFLSEEGRLYVHTRSMVLGIEGGSVTYAQDRASGEVLIASNAYANRPTNTAGFVGFASHDADSRPHSRRPEPSSSVSCSWDGANAVRLIYNPLYSDDGSAVGQLVMDLEVDEASGEIIAQVAGIEVDPSLRPSTIDLPLVGMTTPAVILGSGARYVRGEADAVDQTTYSDLGLNSPNMAVVEGELAVLAAWSETTEFAPEYIQLQHTPAYDHLILHTEQHPQRAVSGEIVSSPWRIGTHTTWLEAARRWREAFEECTGARPLWENRIPWVRNIHAVFDGMSQDYGNNLGKYAELAGIADPEKVLYFLWNGDRIVLMGDHTLARVIGRPTPELLAIIERYDWPLLLYHPYNLINTEVGALDRLGFLADRGWLPNNYQFRPDYDGTPEAWYSHWADVRVSYHGNNGYYLLHSGSTKFQDYLVRNLSGYSAHHHADGVYLDVLGDDNRRLFRDGELAVVGGCDPVTGEASALARVAEELPDLGLMSEYQAQWLLPYIFYSWEGSVTHIRQNAHAHSRINHPLRTALLGSYAWTRESNQEFTDDTIAALLGTLPEVSLVGDHGVSDERARWSQARARLFCEEELFNDLPDAWDEDALAYYRSGSGRWWKFVQRGPTYGYVEIMPDGEEIVRLSR